MAQKDESYISQRKNSKLSFSTQNAKDAKDEGTFMTASVGMRDSIINHSDRDYQTVDAQSGYNEGESIKGS